MSHVLFLKRLLLFFWAVWFSIVFLTNLADAAKALEIIEPAWRFASGNFVFIQKTTERYATPAMVNGALFAGAILWEGLAAALFWRATLSYRGRSSGRKVLYSPFIAALGLWAAFMVVDEIFIAYGVEAAHMRLFIAHLVTSMAIELLPEN